MVYLVVESYGAKGSVWGALLVAFLWIGLFVCYLGVEDIYLFYSI
jgi:hypothetical protein